MESINIFDIVVVSIVLLLGLQGFLHGLVKEVFGLVGIVGGVFVASRYSDEIGKLVDANIFDFQNDSAMSFAGFVIGFITIWIAIYFIGTFITKLTHLSGLGVINRILGFVASALKIFSILAIIIYALSNVKVIKENFLAKIAKDSQVYPLLEEFGGVLVKIDATEELKALSKEAGEATEGIINTIEESTKESANDILEAAKEEVAKEVTEKVKESLVIEEKIAEEKPLENVDAAPTPKQP